MLSKDSGADHPRQAPGDPRGIPPEMLLGKSSGLHGMLKQHIQLPEQPLHLWLPHHKNKIPSGDFGDAKIDLKYFFAVISSIFFSIVTALSAPHVIKCTAGIVDLMIILILIFLSKICVIFKQLLLP